MGTVDLGMRAEAGLLRELTGFHFILSYFNHGL